MSTITETSLNRKRIKRNVASDDFETNDKTRSRNVTKQKKRRATRQKSFMVFACINERVCKFYTNELICVFHTVFDLYF